MMFQIFQLISKRKTDILFASLLFLIAITPRIFLYHAEFWRSPDPIEYINVARNIDSGKGLTQSIKWFFFENSPVITSALKGRPILTSLIFAMLLKIHNDVYFLQAFELVLVSLNVLLIYALARHFFSSRISFLAAFLAALNPNMLISNRLIVSEPICVFFVLNFFIAFYYLEKKPVRYLLLGFISGLAYLTRIEGIYLILILIILERKNIKLASLSILSFFVITFPYLFLNFQENHNSFYSYNSYHFQVHKFIDGMYDGYGKTFPSGLSFITHNFGYVVWAITDLFRVNIKNLIGFSILSFLTLIYFLKARDIVKTFAPFLLFCSFDLFISSVVWAQFWEQERHFTILFPLLLIPVFLVFKNKKSSLKPIAIILFSVTILVYVFLDIHRLVWIKTTEPKLDNWGFSNTKNIYGWIKTHTGNESIVAAPDPWMMNLSTERPSILIPNLKSESLAEKFIIQYHVQYVLAQSDGKSIFKKNSVVVFKDQSLNIYCYFSCSVH